MAEVAVVGLARSGVAVSKLLVRQGYGVYASDAKRNTSTEAAAAELDALGCAVDLGRHDLERITRAQFVVASPGVPPEAPPLAAAHKAGVEILSEVEIALRAMPSTRYIAVTGTKGKSTTTYLIAHLLQALGYDAEAAGNIGTALSIVATRDRLPAWVALEISSFQLHDTPSIAPAVGVLTNLAPDHLDRYDGDVNAYYADKALLFRNASSQSQWVINADYPDAIALLADRPGSVYTVSLRSSSAAWYDQAAQKLMLFDHELMARSNLPLAGDQNVANALTAALAVYLADPFHQTRPTIERMGSALSYVEALPHRFQPVGEFAGVLWVNDSKATDVLAARVAIENMTRPTILLLGGRGKGEEYDSLRDPIAKHCRAVIAYGEEGEKIAAAIAGTAHIERLTGPFEEVLERARTLAQRGDAILLAPAVTSWDMFHDAEERGAAFAAYARGRAGVP
ncbi:MAG TPA: UDP-N-acetylmuramoyl-L-alanine--D-glutamate ligase [Gemmatimonadaceae bacterium]|nr:UDP-N-acetylmuramoyl-L-alanine--D-glutamate ligase [Gemmatimonadaceae bacterium]